MERSTLNIVGCGRLGRAVAKLLFDAGLVQELNVCNRSLESGERAVDEMRCGVARASVGEMPPSSLWILGCGDQDLPEVVELLKRDARFVPSPIVFHCSGVVSSEVLSPLRERGCSVASVHPVRSFASTEMAVRDFKFTLCGCEGDQSAVVVVKDLFSRAGGEVFEVPTEAKLVCHAGHVFASNYLVTILKVARDLYVSAGISEELSWRLMEPLVRGTVDNVMRLGPTAALTGPIARGEGDIIATQLRALEGVSPGQADLYAKLGRATLEIARDQGLSEERCRSIETALD